MTALQERLVAATGRCCIIVNDLRSELPPPCQANLHCVSSLHASTSWSLEPALHGCRRVCNHLPDDVPDMKQRWTAMGFSFRMFLVARDDTLWRLSTSELDRMLRDPADHRLPAFARQRVRMAGVVVEFMASKPMRVIRTTYPFLLSMPKVASTQAASKSSILLSRNRSLPPSSHHPPMRVTNPSSTRRPDSSRWMAGGPPRPPWRAQSMRPLWGNDDTPVCRTASQQAFSYRPRKTLNSA